MLIQSCSNKENIHFIANKYIRLRDTGVSQDEILTVVLNAYKKDLLLKKIENLNQDYSNEENNIVTFSGLCYRAFRDNRAYISKLLGYKEDEEYNLCGLEVSQYIFKHCIKEADFSDYISKVNLLHQLFRRYSLIVHNRLSEEEIKERSEILCETFYEDAKKAIELYKIKTNKFKSFDYLRQLSVLPLIYNNTSYFSNIKYLIIDDADEYSYALWDFVNSIMPYLKECYILYDLYGSTRCGYLCAYKKGVSEFSKRYPQKEIKLENNLPFKDISQKFFENIKSGKKTKFESFEYKSFVKRFNMTEEVIKDVRELIKSGVKQSEIAIITPKADKILINELTDSLIGFECQLISGNEKLIDYDFIKHILNILKLSSGIELKEYELKNLLINLLKIPYKICYGLIKEYTQTKQLDKNGFKYFENNEKHLDSYKKLYSVIETVKKSRNTLNKEIEIIFENLIKNREYDKSKYEFLLKEADSFESAFKNITENSAEQFILQIENSVISENPSDIFKVKNNKVIITTPQKLIDYSINTKYQLWIDVSDSEWLKDDTGTLYNSWVMNREWNKKEFKTEDNIELKKDKTARTVRKLMLLCSKNISFYSSIYDNNAIENYGGLSDFIEISNNNKPIFKIVPRDDQKPVLNYKKGKTGIIAVPGAGKTTILLSLIVKLTENGVSGENIFVLTYMESAAKNFKERLKLILPDTTSLPNISTIHGLALRIIKENANYTKIGLDEGFEIIDETQKERIIKELFFKLKIDDDKYDNFLRCISISKLSEKEGNISSKFKDIREFYNFLNEYNKTLKVNNLIDYDDMLRYAVQLLKENKSILRYYQDLCKYVIEDEAQDSVEIQQKLISLLTGKYNNIVRCGDINQAITSTFTDSSLEGFRDFIKNSNKIEMKSSQRSAEEIYTFANRLIKESVNNENSKNAFYDIEIKGTENNPKIIYKPEYKIFEKDIEEKTFILNRIKEIFQKEPDASIAILLRANTQVSEYNEYFLSNNIKTITRNDYLCEKPIFKIIFQILKLIQNPKNNKEIINLAEIYKQNKIRNITSDEIDFIKNLKRPFTDINTEEIESENLLQLYFDIEYWLNKSTFDIDIQALNIGMYYSKNSIDKSNTAFTVSVIRRLKSVNDKEEDILKKLEYYSQRPLGNNLFFEENTSVEKGCVNIMTMHKSKGDEFDYVFCPLMNEENYPVSMEHVKLKSGGHFVQTIKRLETDSEIKQPLELKSELICETLRLLYVGITRAKKGLFLSNSRNTLKRKNTENIKIIEEIINFNNILQNNEFDKNKCYNSSS